VARQGLLQPRSDAPAYVWGRFAPLKH
jgi:hypothetical protein